MVKVVVVVEMKEEMEKNEVVVLVVKMEGKWWRNGWPKEGHGCWCVLCWNQGRRKKKK